MSVLAAKSDEPIPGYKVKSRLGAGGYGEVWTCEAPGQLLKAIKFVYGMLDEDRAARELKALNRIKGVRHPFLLSLERIEVVDGHLIIITELADGSLKDRYEECRKAGDPGIGRTELLNHVRDAADALDYMSEQHSLQHLDVKPENLLLVGGRIKVADFGLVKDIQEATASMMGGLTPVYAPPEVFEGSPSKRSDQYSLAIVFQEMLTGVLPFPGKTAAQLAAQHLNAKPRLSALPAADQPVIARALAKNPKDRFSSCRELVNALEAAGKVQVSVSMPSAPGVTQTQGPPKSLAATEAGLAPSPPVERPRTTSDMLGQLEAASQAVATAVGDVAADVPIFGGELVPAPTPCVDCPPPKFEPQTITPPALLIGVGGTGGRVLQRLRRRLKDRGDSTLEQRTGFLLLDTDSRDIMRATHGEEGAALSPDETLAMPLRRTQDYRNETGRSYDWLSRRWLYNIPRSLQTEGLRPLGRLAVIDHAAEMLTRIQSAVDRLAQTEATLAKSEGRSPLPPRVVLVGSIAGGTASGAIADIAYAVRQVLDEARLTAAPVDVILGHSTNRSPQAQELAVVNTFAALSELNQFERKGGSYPGDFGAGIQPRQTSVLRSVYMVDLGAELSADDYHHSCDNLAEFLYLDIATTASSWLSACRNEPADATSDRPTLALRSFGLCQMGVAQDSIIDQAATRLCRATIERFIGVPRQPSESTTTRVFPLANANCPNVHDSVAAKDSQIDTIAATQAATLGLELDRLLQLMHQQAAKELGGNPDHCFRSIAMAFEPENGVLPLDRWLAAVMELFGSRIGAEGPPKTSQLQTNLNDHARAVAAALGGAARKWLDSLVDHPAARLYGAQRATKWLQGHLKSLAERMRETRLRLNEEWYSVEQQLIATVRPDARSKSKTPPQSPENLLLQLCRMRMLELSAQSALALIQALEAHLLAAQDSLADLSRELQNLGQRFAAPEDAISSEAQDELERIKASVAQQLKSNELELAVSLDEQLTNEVIAPAGGLRQVLQSADTLNPFIERLETLARTTILRRLDSVDFATLLFRTAAGGANSQLMQLLSSAQPRLQACGGQRRLLCVLPESSGVNPGDVTRILQTEASVFRATPAVVRDPGSSDVVLCFEMGQLPLAQVAATVIDHRPDLLECAERIHTRADVAWQPLLRLPN